MSEEMNPVVEGAEVVEQPVCEICGGEVCECVESPCTCVAENNAKWGEVGHEIPGKFYQVYYGGKVMFDDEALYDAFRANSTKVSSISIEPAYPNYKYNKYGVASKNEEITVTIVANEELKAANPLALVVVDGKTYDLAYLDSAISFVMNKDHKISIHWDENLVESFRIVAKK